MEKCKELFLEDIVKVCLFQSKSCQFPIPFSIQNIQEMTGYTLPKETMAIGLDANIITAKEGTLSAKSTQERTANGVIYTFSIEATVEGKEDDLSMAYNKIIKEDHVAVIYTQDGMKYLCYSLPNTFDISMPITINGYTSTKVSLSMKSCSNFIRIK